MDTAEGAFDYDALNLSGDPLAVMAGGALDAGIGVRGRVGEADCHLFPARELTAFAVAWLEERFGTRAG
jgi:aminoglycoside 3-N-acetyltransferase